MVELEGRGSQEFVLKVENMPGLHRVVVSRIRGKLTGDLELRLVHEFFYDDGDAVRQVIVSLEGRQPARR